MAVSPRELLNHKHPSNMQLETTSSNFKLRGLNTRSQGNVALNARHKASRAPQKPKIAKPIALHSYTRRSSDCRRLTGKAPKSLQLDVLTFPCSEHDKISAQSTHHIDRGGIKTRILAQMLSVIEVRKAPHHVIVTKLEITASAL